ncbi:TonB-dependent receptor [Mariniflexile sp. AS56]|uniref:TonB-dependent receptor n=1 Tax=Mariniflexile sp. AS56 TaxID=3063957 RepID=UPI0026EDE484|nr:TonB-dependent receptor [Mariniflexile sp. AS56]MDO7171761.1 TonB-dependent receptor [Mariniflexile sp. AS56]
MKKHKQLILKTISFLVVLLFATFHSYSQQFIKGRIIDIENGTPIENVVIKDLENRIVTISNVSGQFELPKKGIYQFVKTGYQQKSYYLKSNFTIVQLDLNPSYLNEVIVSAHHLPQKLKTAHTTIDLITLKDINRGNTTNLNDVLNRIPSVFMQSGALNTNKISIRGIGSRNLYGTSKIRAYFQDIPLTSGNGSTTIEDFELGSISRLEIIKGAGSSIYGAGLGGTIHLIPQSAYLNETSINSNISLGSFGLLKSILNVNHGSTKHSFRAVYSSTHSDGYRDNNEYNRKTFTVNSNHFLSKKDDIAILASYVNLNAFIPSSINENTYINNPKSAAFTWAQSKGYEDSQRAIIGASWKHQFNNNTKQVTSVFTSFKEAYEPRPFNILTENTAAYGIRSRVIGRFKKINWTLGGEIFKDTYKSRNFENLYKEYPAGTGSVEGAKFSDFKEHRTYYNLFFETNYNMSLKTTLSIGLNLNQTSYKIIDRFITDENPDQSGNYKFKGMLSPKFGISHVFTENVSIYSNLSHGFSPPSTEETLLPDGLINTNIKPETGWNFEIGSRSTFFDNRLQLNIALYRLDVRNLLVARRTGDDQFIGVNAGKTRHDGLEVVLKYDWLQSEKISINHYTSYTLNNFKFKEFIDDDTNFSGNILTGVPSNVFNSGIDLDTKLGLYSSINYQYVGRIPMTDSNILFSDRYNLTNIKLGYRQNINQNLKLNVYFGLDNVFNKHYASQILINATGFGGAAPRYYYPGNPINYYTGINLSYMF